MHFVGLIFVAFQLILAKVTGDEHLSNAGSKLIRDLFDRNRYDGEMEPHLRIATWLDVYLKLRIRRVEEIDENTGVLTTTGFFAAKWNDSRLVWDSSKYGHIQKIYVQKSYVWLPQLSIYNQAKQSEFYNQHSAQANVHQNGTVEILVATTILSTCAIDHKYYPFDKHSCTIDIGSWAMENKLNFKRCNFESINKISDDKNDQWDLVYQKDEVINRKFDCCPGFFPFYRVNLTLIRRVSYYRYILIISTVSSMFMVLLSFWMPITPNSNAKLILAQLGTVDFFLLTLYLGYEIPVGSKSIPIIVLFCAMSFVTAAISVGLAVIGNRIYSICLTTKEVPAQIKNLINSCGTIMGMGHQNFRGPLQIKNISSVNRVKSDNLSTVNENEPLNEDWIIASLVFDRICFIIYCFVFLCIILISFL
ncbi:hypothetical protein CHUAL_007052 [Chamberlinius hualienensis]